MAGGATGELGLLVFLTAFAFWFATGFLSNRLFKDSDVRDVAVQVR